MLLPHTSTAKGSRKAVKLIQNSKPFRNAHLAIHRKGSVINGLNSELSVIHDSDDYSVQLRSDEPEVRELRIQAAVVRFG